MFENLSDKLDRAFKVLKGQGTITEINVAKTMKEIRKALLDADVNYKTAKAFTDEVRHKALGQNVLTAVSPGQLLTKIMNDELAALMGSYDDSPEAQDLYERAYALSEQVPDHPSQFPLYWGWWRGSRDFRVKKQRASALLARAISRDDPELLLQAHHSSWATHYDHVR